MNDSQRGTAALALRPGARPVPEYELVRLLGRGGFGEVWQATGPGGFAVALKLIPLRDRAGQVEARALEVMKGLRHPHLLPLFGAWQKGGLLVVAMELAERPLLARLEEALAGGLPGVPAAELLGYLREAARALDFLNDPRHPGPDGRPAGVQHRDVKPANLLLLGGSVKVGDFGLARLLEGSSASASGAMTPAYAAPECFEGRTSRWSDQYSLAVTYCHLRGGRLPFAGAPAEVMAGHLTRPPDLTMLPAAERAAVARALSKSPEQRWPSCVAFAEALATAQGPAPVPTTRSCPGEKREGKSRRWVVALALVALLGGLGVVGAFAAGAFRRPRPEVPPKGPVAAPAPTPQEALEMVRRLGGKVTVGDARAPETVREIDLNKTRVTGADLKLLATLPALRRLLLDHCEHLDDAALAHLARLPALRELGLSYTAVGDAGLAHLAGLPLEELDLTVTLVSDEGLRHLAGMTHLRELGLVGCKNVDGRGLALLSGLPLSKLLLSWSERIDNDSLTHLRDWKRLEHLNLSATRVTDEGLLRLRHLKKLRRLDLVEAPVTDAGVARLRAALPNLTEVDR